MQNFNQSIKSKIIKGFKTTAISQVASALVQVISLITLSRILNPEDFGAIAMVASVTAFAKILNDLGLSTATVRSSNLTPDQISNIFWINLVIGSLMSILTIGLSPYIALFFHKPELQNLTQLLSSTFIISSIGSQYGAILQKNMQFAKKAISEIVGAVVNLLISIGFALNGFGYWSLAYGIISGSIITCLLLVFLSPLKIQKWNKHSSLKPVIKFGVNVTTFEIVNYFARNLDNILIGKFFGPGVLGLYARAYQLIQFTVNNIRGPITAVMLPAYSKMQEDHSAIRSFYKRSVNVTAWISMPFVAAIWLSARELILILLGGQWIESYDILRWLAVSAFIQPCSGLIGSVLLSLGQSSVYLKCGVYNTLVISAAFLIGIKWGAVGVAIAYAICNYGLIYPWYKIAMRKTPLKVKDFIYSCQTPSILCVIGCYIVSQANSILIIDRSILASAAAKTLLFAFTMTILITIVKQARQEISYIIKNISKPKI